MLARINDVELYYDLNGKGMPLLLMHGGMGVDHTCFRPWLDPLAEHASLIYYDHRGNGRSSLVRDFGKLDPAVWADDADAMLAHLGHQKAVVFGHSVGGFVAQDFARRYRDRVAGLILCDATPAMDYPGIVMANAQARSTPEQMPLILKMFTEPFPDNDAMRKVFGEILSLYFKTYDPAIGAALVNGIHYNHQAFNYCASWFASFNSRSWPVRSKSLRLSSAAKRIGSCR